MPVSLGKVTPSIERMSPGRQFQQLPMFMTAGELRNPRQTTPGDFTRLQGPALVQAWDQKLSESGFPMRQSIAQTGVSRPVVIQHNPRESPLPILGDGHHRVASAYAHSHKALVPVEHQAF